MSRVKQLNDYRVRLQKVLSNIYPFISGEDGTILEPVLEFINRLMHNDIIIVDKNKLVKGLSEPYDKFANNMGDFKIVCRDFLYISKYTILRDKWDRLTAKEKDEYYEQISKYLEEEFIFNFSKDYSVDYEIKD